MSLFFIFFYLKEYFFHVLSCKMWGKHDRNKYMNKNFVTTIKWNEELKGNVDK